MKPEVRDELLAFVVLAVCSVVGAWILVALLGWLIASLVVLPLSFIGGREMGRYLDRRNGRS